MQACMHTHTHIHTHSHAYLHTCTPVYTHTHTHTNTHTPSLSPCRRTYSTIVVHRGKGLAAIPWCHPSACAHRLGRSPAELHTCTPHPEHNDLTVSQTQMSNDYHHGTGGLAACQLAFFVTVALFTLHSTQGLLSLQQMYHTGREMDKKKQNENKI